MSVALYDPNGQNKKKWYAIGGYLISGLTYEEAVKRDTTRQQRKLMSQSKYKPDGSLVTPPKKPNIFKRAWNKFKGALGWK